MSDSDDTASSVRRREELPQSADIPDSGKRRKLTDGGSDRRWADWTLELSPGTDETLQLGRVSGVRAQSNETALDS
ncbi:hypothetical protein IW136_005622, partial [Coemansia sp. RSA 678]